MASASLIAPVDPARLGLLDRQTVAGKVSPASGRGSANRTRKQCALGQAMSTGSCLSVQYTRSATAATTSRWLTGLIRTGTSGHACNMRALAWPV
jgi:hypothetical protein